MFYKNKMAFFVVLLCLFSASVGCFATEEINFGGSKYPNYSDIYIGDDRFENFNRKMFDFNLRMNKYVVRPIHVLWASIMPKYGMDRITGITKNIEYPIRLMSTLIQKDFSAAKTETIRFFTNTTIGLGGMFDPAKRLFKMEHVQENMEQALAKCKVKSGSYLVMPVLSSTTPRGILGKILDSAFNPTSYIASPAIAAIKAALTVNRTYYMQPILHLIESTYADPYDIAKKMYGLENYIRCTNIDRMNLVDDWQKDLNTNVKQSEVVEEKHIEVSTSTTEKTIEIEEEVNLSEVLQGSAEQTEILLKQRNLKHALENLKLVPDITLSNYNPQSPVIDSMRTALFEVAGMDNSFWADFSIWNRGFYKRLKLSSVNLFEGRPNYKYRFLLQKNQSSPIAIIYPSIGEGIMSTHSAMLGKIFYDEGYSVVILGSHFQWEFVKSMPEDFCPGNPSEDVEFVKLTTDKVLASLQQKYNKKFTDKIVMGTSFGAMMALFVGQKEFNPNAEEQHSKYIAVCPPIDLFYAMKQIDKNTEEWKNSPESLKDKVALTAVKIIQIMEKKDSVKAENITLPFSDEEAKLITGFVLHQKLSDLIFTLEKTPKLENSEIYNLINNMNYNDYVNKYLVKGDSAENVFKKSNLGVIVEYLKNGDNYKIYHSLDDYLTNTKQLHRLKLYSGTKTVLFEHGSHLGFLYRPEFLKELKKEITLKSILLSEN